MSYLLTRNSCQTYNPCNDPCPLCTYLSLPFSDPGKVVPWMHQSFVKLVLLYPLGYNIIWNTTCLSLTTLFSHVAPYTPMKSSVSILNSTIYVLLFFGLYTYRPVSEGPSPLPSTFPGPLLSSNPQTLCLTLGHVTISHYSMFLLPPLLHPFNSLLQD